MQGDRVQKMICPQTEYAIAREKATSDPEEYAK
jgi:hypothetical protein